MVANFAIKRPHPVKISKFLKPILSKSVKKLTQHTGAQRGRFFLCPYDKNPICSELLERGAQKEPSPLCPFAHLDAASAFFTDFDKNALRILLILTGWESFLANFATIL